MKLSTTLALFVFAASLANATLNYAGPEVDWSDPYADSSMSAGDFFAATPPPDLPEPGSIEDPNVVKCVFEEDPDAHDPAAGVWIEVFHAR
jgi:hypothetical protein